jgi:transposase, IS30 family
MKRLSPELEREVRRLAAKGHGLREIGRLLHCSRHAVSNVLVREPPPLSASEWNPSPARLSMNEREEIRAGLERGESFTTVARSINRSVSTVSREVAANGGRDGYRAWQAHRDAGQRARRPKTPKLVGRLAEVVTEWLGEWWSPEEIACRLRLEFPDDPMMWVSHETIYQSLFVQGRGELRRELHRCLRTGRAQRRPRSRLERRGHIPEMVMISERPAEVEDRAVPGHWEGDLIIGKNQASQIGTLVERSTGFVQLLHLPDNRSAEVVADAMITTIKAFPDTLRRTLTWDQGHEMAQHARISIDAGIDIYFCDPHSPWQRGSNENTNGLLRQYFPKGTDLSVHTVSYLAEVAAELNTRPRKRFEWDSPTQVLNRLLSDPSATTVATKP